MGSCVFFDSFFNQRLINPSAALAQWDVDGSGLVGSNGVDAAIKMRPNDDEVADLGPDFTDRWNTFYKDKPDKPLFWLSALGGLPADQSGLPATTYLSSGCFMGYPTGRGHVHISGSDIYATPDFDSGFLSGDKSDLAILRWGYKKGREIIRRMGVFRGALTPAHPAFASGSDATLNETEPVALTAPKIVYSAADDAAIDDNIKNLGTSLYR